MGKNMTKTYKESKNYSDNIMKDVTRILDENNIKYEVNSNCTEVTITEKDGQSRESISNTLYANANVPKIVFMLLVNIVEVNGTIYIRQSTK